MYKKVQRQHVALQELLKQSLLMHLYYTTTTIRAISYSTKKEPYAFFTIGFGSTKKSVHSVLKKTMQTLPMLLTQFRQPYGTREVSLSAARFPS